MNQGRDYESWPNWLEQIYGPWPDGPRKRAEALEQDRRRMAEADRRMREKIGQAQA